MESAIKKTEDAALLLAKNAATISYEHLPADVVDITKKGILDTLGVILGATGTMSEIKTLVELVRGAGGKEESTILGFGDRVPAWHAGYVNGAAAHCLDYDDMHASGEMHLHAPVVPAALAMAEQQGASGKKLITAVAVGVDLLCRLGLAVSMAARGEGHRQKWYIMSVGGVFASAAACGNLLGLDADKMVNALGIAFTQAAGTIEIAYGLDSNIRGISHAPPGEVGVRAALMAQRGITGVRNSFEGRAGLMNMYFGGEYDRSVLIGDLGKTFPALDDGFKPWPACGGIHIYIDLTLGLVEEHDVRPEEIEEITVTIGDFAQNLCEPLKVKRRPATTMNAKFSLPFTVAVAAVRRKVVIGDYTLQGLADPAVLALAQRVNYMFDPDYNIASGMPPGKVEIKTKGGKTYSRQGEIAYGHHQKPMSWDDLVAKFRECAAYSAKPLPQRNVNKAIELLTHLDEVDNVSKVVRLLG